jgi:MinD-like ATPase involved in chromosome partitioning or flagellar assembly
MSAGTVVTFYSYKGGVGRSQALANCAVILARWGFRVLCVDWDLEAPGLRHYLLSGKAGAPIGLVDLLLDPSTIVQRWRKAVSKAQLTASPDGLKVSLDVIMSNGDPSRAAEQLRRLNWDALFEDQSLFAQLEGLREKWCSSYDFVLLDSRTGISDVGGICTIQMPDILVMLTTASDQSLEGTLHVAERAEQAREMLPIDRQRMPIIPVPSRMDTRVEYGMQRHWLDRYADAFENLTSPWLNKTVVAKQLFELLRIPYVPFWSYGEKLAVSEESARDAESLSYWLETLAALIARKLDKTELLVQSRDEYVRAASELRQHKARPDFFLSSSYETIALTRDLARLLEGRGKEVHWSGEDNADVDISFSDSGVFASNIVFVVPPSGVTRWQMSELSSVYRQLARSTDEEVPDTNVIVIVPSESEGIDLPSTMASLVRLRMSDFDGSLDRVASELLSRLQLAKA